MVDDNYLHECLNSVTTDIHRYFITVHLTLGMKHYLDNNLECSFIAAERTLKNASDQSKEIDPDLIFQYENGTKGILGEIKSSLSHNELNVKNNVFEQLRKYDHDVIGWDSPDNLVETHDILHLLHMLDSDWYISVYKKYDGSEINLHKNYCIVEFTDLTSVKAGQGDIILVRYKYGTLGCGSLLSKFKENLHIEIDNLSNNYERLKFTRKKPPLAYLMDKLWFFIFTSFGRHKIDNDFVDVNLGDITKIAQDYYYPWAGIEGENSQLRISWIKEALNMFVKINLAEKIEPTADQYRIHLRKKNLPNDMGKYIIEQICKKYIEEHPRKITDAQTSLDNFEIESVKGNEDT